MAARVGVGLYSQLLVTVPIQGILPLRTETQVRSLALGSFSIPHLITQLWDEARGQKGRLKGRHTDEASSWPRDELDPREEGRVKPQPARRMDARQMHMWGHRWMKPGC